ncbi:MAG: hypothetical protein V3W44_11005 [Dehalococcoidales bacterium]
MTNRFKVHLRLSRHSVESWVVVVTDLHHHQEIACKSYRSIGQALKMMDAIRKEKIEVWG